MLSLPMRGALQKVIEKHWLKIEKLPSEVLTT